MDTNRIESLLAQATQDELSPAGVRELVGACKGDPELSVRLVGLLKIERLIGLALRRDEAAFEREFRSRVEAEAIAAVDGGADSDGFADRVAGRLRRSKIARFLLASTAAAAAIALAAVFIFAGADHVVEIVRTEATEWQPEGSEIAVGQRISFQSGLVELRYSSGVRVVIEAPADFEISGRNRGYLHYGKLVAEVDDASARGFVIDGPAGRLVDLGTKFAVEVDWEGDMEVHVIEGKVDATANGGTTSHLVKDQALRLFGGKASPMEADAGKFITQMPSYRNQPPRFVRWSFDDGGDSPHIAKNSGRDLAQDSADAKFRSFSGRRSGPVRISDAPFGEGLRFDGRDAFLETDYRGISGGNPRTVAFWVRVPKDSGQLEGYGIINWGDIRRIGGAWQISVNTTAEDGRSGCLRIGTHGGQVIGTTELRDSEWHHCAVVLYGDESGEPNTSTHILLYIDGQLEPTARKSVRLIDTAIAPRIGAGEHGVWMGRNLGYEFLGSSSGESYGKFFRGDVDEMVICDMALNQKQILRLMEENVMP